MSVFPALSLGVCTYAHTQHETPTHPQPSLVGHKNAVILLLLWNACKTQHCNETPISSVTVLSVWRPGVLVTSPLLESHSSRQNCRHDFPKATPTRQRSAECLWPQTSSKEWQEAYESWSESKKQKCLAIAALSYKHRKSGHRYLCVEALQEPKHCLLSTSQLSIYISSQTPYLLLMCERRLDVQCAEAGGCAHGSHGSAVSSP